MPLAIYYGGSRVPSPGVNFTYRENPVLLAFQPLRSFVRCGLALLSLARYFPGTLCPLGS